MKAAIGSVLAVKSSRAVEWVQRARSKDREASSLLQGVALKVGIGSVLAVNPCTRWSGYIGQDQKIARQARSYSF